ncbi:MAG: prolyl oligopeptidase family serine peptidase [Bacteroidales bacterium]
MDKRVLLATGFILCMGLLKGQDYSAIEGKDPRFETARYFSSDSIYKKVGSMTLDASWFRESDHLYFYKKEGGKKKYWLVDPSKGKQTELFQIEDTLNCYISGFKEGSNELLECRKDGKNLYYSIKGRSFTEIPKDTVSKENKTKAFSREYWKNYSHDSSYYMYGHLHDIYLHDVDKGEDLRMSYDGEPFFSFTTFRSAQTDTSRKSVRGNWLGNTNYAIFLRPDMRSVTEMTVVNSLSNPPKAKNYKMELTNDSLVTRYGMYLLDANKQELVKVDIDRFKDQEVKLLLNYHKAHEYDKIYFTRKSRGNDTIQLCDLDPVTRQVRVLAEEIGKPIVNELLHSVHILNGGNDIIWWSEREGLGAYYLYNKDGELENKIAGGDFVAGKVFNIDTLGRSFVFEGYGYYKERNPYEKYYFSVGFNGRKFKCLTPSQGNHAIEYSKSKEYFTDTYSSPDKFPQKEVRSVKGKLVSKLPAADTMALLDYGWIKPVALELLSSDNKTKLYGVMYLPGKIEPGAKYPVICNMYPGPQTDLVPRSFATDDNDNAALARMGFVVVNVGLIGSSPLRGPQFYSASQGNLRDYAVDDVKYVVEQVAQRYSFADTSRVGIYGHSGGGFLTVTAMLKYPRFFKVGVSVSGNHDNNIYAKFWGETYNGVGPKIKTNMELAKNLQGKLLLMTGDVDDNVHPANTYRMVDAFIKADKRIDMFVIPGADHNMYGNYYNKLIHHYFINNL